MVSSHPSTRPRSVAVPVEALAVTLVGRQLPSRPSTYLLSHDGAQVSDAEI